MNNGTCVIFVLFYIFRHYKRVGVEAKRNELISDLKKCHLILKRMEKGVDPDISIEIIEKLINRVNTFGANLRLQQPIRYADYNDSEIIALMRSIMEEIIYFASRPFYKKYSSEIFTRFLVLHNLPRALLKDTSGDLSTVQDFHISKQEALKCASIYLEYKQE